VGTLNKGRGPITGGRKDRFCSFIAEKGLRRILLRLAYTFLSSVLNHGECWDFITTAWKEYLQCILSNFSLEDELKIHFLSSIESFLIRIKHHA
jgi:hypothetical protein